ncbi:MAG: DUF4292 domain-containing protein [Crocinitomicaceae bacterium]|nr:DUF4292 domain-containing protein [Crocinitomicaceae bacterium]MBK8927599.1 DUF4292 domain-containing protein [Crocinitomicaceae bacterium]
MKINSIHYIYTLTAAVSFLLLSCKTKADSGNEPMKRLNDKELLEHLDSINIIPFEFFYSKIGIDFTSSVRSNSFKATVKMKIDSAFSGTLSVGPVIGATYLVATDSIFFTDKMKSCYFKEDFKYLSMIFGTEIAYNFFQDLILGLPVGYDEDLKYNIKHTRDFYILSSYKKRELKKPDDKEEDNIFVQYYINTATRNLDKISIQVPSDTVDIDIDYMNRVNYDNFMLPELTKIRLVHPRDSIFVNMDYGSVKLNERKEIGINIPESYVKCD